MPFGNVIDRSDAAPLIPEEVSAEIVQGLSQSSAVMRLARRLPNMARGQQRIPVLSALPIAYFVAGDTGLKQTTELNWANKYLDAEEIACIVPVPKKVLDDADYDIWGQAKPLIVSEMGRVFDAAVLFGTNAPATWPANIRAAALAAGNSVALGAGPDVYDDVLGQTGTMAKVEADGFAVTGHVAAISMKARLRGLRDANGQPIFTRSVQAGSSYELDAAPIHFPENGGFETAATHMISGAFSQLVYAMRQDISFTIATEGVIQDAGGNIVYNLFQQDMVALKAVMRAAWQVPNPVNAMQPAEASRYPFAVLTA